VQSGLPVFHGNVWIGSVLVIVLTGLYTMLGGMRAVAYNDAVQVTVLIVGSGLLAGLARFMKGRPWYQYLLSLAAIGLARDGFQLETTREQRPFVESQGVFFYALINASKPILIPSGRV
jgi:Na+/proline symporter